MESIDKILNTLPENIAELFKDACIASHKYDRYWYLKGYYGFNDRFEKTGHDLYYKSRTTRDKFVKKYMDEFKQYPEALMHFYYCVVNYEKNPFKNK